MKRSLKLGLAGVAAAASALTVTGLTAAPARATTAATVYVDTTGSAGADCLTPATACLTVSEGVAAAQALLTADSSNSTDVTVSIAAGAYTDNVTINSVPDGDTLALAGHAASDTSISTGTHGYSSIITVNGGAVTISNLTLAGGDAGGAGGAIYNTGVLTVSGSTLSGNYAEYGAGIDNGGTLTVSGSTLSGNNAEDGGGIRNYGTLTVSGSTLSGNIAYGRGGGIDNEGGRATVSGSTLSNNAYSGILNNFGSVTLAASIVSESPCDTNGTAVTDGGYNVTSDHSCVSAGGTSVVDSTSIHLGALASNGSSGPRTQSIDASSSAHQLVPTSSGLCAANDERRAPRPGVAGASNCDAGAFELQAGPPRAQTITFTSPLPLHAVVGGTYTATATGGGSGNPVQFYVDATTDGVCTVTPSGSVTFTAAGKCRIDATQAGNTFYAAAHITPQVVTVYKAPQTIMVQTPPPASPYPFSEYDLYAVGGASGNPLTFTVHAASTGICDIYAQGSGWAYIDLLAPGRCAITIRQAGNASYKVATKTYVFRVKSA